MLTNRKNRLITFSLIFLLVCFVFPINEFDVHGATKSAVIKNGPLNVRSGAGTNYKKLGTIAKGKKITIKTTKKDKKGKSWYAITFKSKTGYVAAQYVTVSTPASSSSSGTKTYSPAKAAKIKNGPLCVRTGAGTSYKTLGTIAKGKAVSLKGEKKAKNGSKWYKITFKSKTAYIASSYVIINKTATASKNVTTTLNRKAIIKNGPLNVRSGPGTNYSKIGSVAKGKTITVQTQTKTSNGQVWYRYAYSSKKNGYILSSYVTLTAAKPAAPAKPTPAKPTPVKPTPTTPGGSVADAQFETYMTSQGFPSTYKAKLRALHKAHPQWIFKAQKTNMTWTDALKKESAVGINLVESTSPASWKSKASGAYNSKTGKYTIFDGRWNAASDKVTAHYLDPRNFLTDASIYQFMDHNFDAKSQTKDTIKSMVSRNSCFMNTSSYINYLYNAGSKSKVNPNVITAMVIMEQGWKGGSGLISGKTSGYTGYYNHFNIGAYTAGNMSATQRGLWWAKGAGTNATTYSRPWNTIEKSLTGGASYYAGNYVQKKQYTYYTKKFNVMNGASKVPTHQYMTNVSGAESEGKILAYAYANNNNYPIVFHIPVYNSMPSAACVKPK